MPGPPTLADLLTPVEGSELAAELEAIRRALSGGGVRVYLVGGLVRDLLLGRSSRDVDLAVDGPETEVMDRLAEALGGVPRHHPPFLTAGLETARGFTVDVARLRRETYREPGALPEVEPGDLAEDLGRRDFTVNSMAMALTEESSPLIDFHDGLEDLAARRLRVLHSDSFSDDPTRVLRGIRLAEEIGLAFDDGTRELAAEPATGAALRRVSGFRIWRELRRCFRTREAARRAVAELAALDLSGAIHPALARVSTPADLDKDAGPLASLAAWCRELDPLERGELAQRLALTREERRAIGARPRGRGPRVAR